MHLHIQQSFSTTIYCITISSSEQPTPQGRLHYLNHVVSRVLTCTRLYVAIFNWLQKGFSEMSEFSTYVFHFVMAALHVDLDQTYKSLSQCPKRCLLYFVARASQGKKRVESFWNHCEILQRITHKSHA